MLILEVCDALGAAGVRFAVAGGYAVALHGAVRGTVDLDLVLSCDEASYVTAESTLASIGLVSRLPVSAREVFRFRREYIDNRNLIAWSFWDPNDPTRLVDLVLTFEGKRIPSKKVTFRGSTIPVLSKEALIRMKEASGRPQDLEDVAALRRIR